jgi:hypothetical protein
MKWFFERIMSRAVCFKAGGGGSNQPIITDDMKEQARVSADEWNRYVKDHLPAVEQYVAKKTTEDVGLTESKLRGTMNADMAQRTAGTDKVPAGVDPSRSLMAQGLNMQIAGKAASGGMVDVTQGAQDRKVAEMGQLVAAGRGQKVEALGGLNQLAASSSDVALIKAKSDQYARFAEEAATANLVGAGLNAATSAGMYGAQNGWFSGDTGTASYVKNGLDNKNWTGNPALSNFQGTGFSTSW